MPARKSAKGRGNRTSGRPAGTGPMTGASFNHSTPKRVTATIAGRGAGTNLARRWGQTNTRESVAAVMMTALRLMSSTAAGKARIAPTVPPGTAGAPRIGRI